MQAKKRAQSKACKKKKIFVSRLIFEQFFNNKKRSNIFGMAFSVHQLSWWVIDFLLSDYYYFVNNFIIVLESYEIYLCNIQAMAYKKCSNYIIQSWKIYKIEVCHSFPLSTILLNSSKLILLSPDVSHVRKIRSAWVLSTFFIIYKKNDLLKTMCEFFGIQIKGTHDIKFISAKKTIFVNIKLSEGQFNPVHFCVTLKNSKITALKYPETGNFLMLGQTVIKSYQKEILIFISDSNYHNWDSFLLSLYFS